MNKPIILKAKLQSTKGKKVLLYAQNIEMHQDFIFHQQAHHHNFNNGRLSILAKMTSFQEIWEEGGGCKNHFTESLSGSTNIAMEITY